MNIAPKHSWRSARTAELQWALDGVSDKLRGLLGGVQRGPASDGGLLEWPHILLDLLRTADNLCPVQEEVLATEDCQHCLAQDRRTKRSSILTVT